MFKTRNSYAEYNILTKESTMHESSSTSVAAKYTSVPN